jgi:hypothetical protein
VSTHVRRVCRGTATYFLARLDREHPELAARVRNGELTTASAAIKAGYLKPRMALPKDPEAAATAILRRWGPDSARRFAVLLTEMADNWDPRDPSTKLHRPIPSEAAVLSERPVGRVTPAAETE